MDWGNLITGIVAGAVAFVAGVFTRRSAKEANAGQLYSGLTTHQTAELQRMSGESARTSQRLTALEEDREQSRQMARTHESWDRVVIRKLRSALPDEEFPDPPPLDV